MNEIYKKHLLEMVHSKQLSAEEGLKFYKSLQHISVSPEEPIKADNRIAIIGLSGRFPGASDVESYWRNLEKGIDSVQEIDRWDPASFYSKDPKAKDKSYCKEGGLLSNIDKFDPLFFNISPKQAELMDPRQRLFLQEAWKTFEDAGYSNRSLASRKIGVFVGCEGDTDYFQLNERQHDFNSEIFLGNSNSILASRISYFMDLKGPSITLDTACSSSLVAIHIASESLRANECEMALCGGVALYTTPHGYVLASRMGMLSATGRCRTFDDAADGFVPGEAVVSILLKRFDQAVMDGDHIYGIISASGVNQDGKTNGITAPSGRSQKELITDIYKKFNIHPETISYVEAHGTGTKLGDPIEFHALKEAFEQYTSEKQFCGLGSVKTNIGHTGAVSGLAGIVKVLMSMKYNKIPPSLHFSSSNKQINFDESPFYVVDVLKDWKAQGAARRAAVSSFGHSGTNCHMVIEEHCISSEDRKEEHPLPFYLIPISAKSEAILKEKIADLLSWCCAQKQSVEIADVAYTLQVGRSHFDYRTIIKASDMKQLISKLRDANPLDSSSFSLGKKDKKTRNYLLQNKDTSLIMHRIKDSSLSTNEQTFLLDELCQLYLGHVDIVWQDLYEPKSRMRISMPLYPFSEKRFWLEEKPTESRKIKSNPSQGIHPLIDVNESTFGNQKFKKVFLPSEWFVKDHLVDGGSVVPGSTYLEMARMAGELSHTDQIASAISEVYWVRPLSIKESTLTYISLEAFENYDEFRVVARINGLEQVYTKGKIHLQQHNEKKPELGHIPIEYMKSNFNSTLTPEECYHFFESMGLKYQTAFRTIDKVWTGKHEVLSQIYCPEYLLSSFSDFVLHPALIDGAFQSLIGLEKETKFEGQMFLPFSIGKITWNGTLDPSCYVHIRYDEFQAEENRLERKYQLAIANMEGKIIVQISDYLVRLVHEAKRAVQPQDSKLLDMLVQVKDGMMSEHEVLRLLEES
ncbi:type I polyketide synthase [Saccharibacillus sacchari]|uniref:Type I polyketide synthase n=1 Tax=Saccharibacillus sacchari TaxID=456493 RepID=A0ACC6P6Z0_9BACL